jgi:hypothetical protein
MKNSMRSFVLIQKNQKIKTANKFLDLMFQFFSVAYELARASLKQRRLKDFTMQ